MSQATHTSGSLTLEHLHTPIGTLLIVTDTRGMVHAIDWGEDVDRRRGYRCWDSHGLRPPDADSPARRALATYFAGDVHAIDSIVTAADGTSFQHAIWRTLRCIPPGEPWTYGRLAHAAGRARAVRAAGASAGANPIAIVVPCHRVIGATGALTGYRGGLARKEWLLAWEADATRARLGRRAAAGSSA